MLQKKYKSRLVSIVNPIKGIYTLEFESLNGKYKYHPGQFLHLAIDSDYDGCGQWPESRCFSMQSNPNEELIRIAYSVKGKFTTNIEQQLRVGSEVWLKLPYGDLFTKSHNKTKTVFIAGGTGVTPFLSLFTHESFKNYLDPKIYLGFKSFVYNIYSNELNMVKYLDPKIFYEDVHGMLNIKQIFKENGIYCDYFISGPPVMIKSFKHSLSVNGVPETHILTDDWE